MRRSRLATAVLLSLGCGASLHAQTSTTAPAAQVGESARERILRIAEAYADFEWKASARNIHHADDAEGVRVDTPDSTFDEDGWRADGTVNRGMPYAWGGFSSIAEFRAGLAAGKFAGLVPKSERAGASQHAVGLDCSGYVARCWELPVKQSTRSLGRLCTPLDGADELQPGDILNKFDSHVVLFKEWVDEEKKEMRVLEAARLRVQESSYATATILKSGFVPMRYLPLDPTWVPMAKTPPTFQSDGIGVWVPEEKVAKALETEAHPLQTARVGAWAEYTVKDQDPVLPPHYTLKRQLARREAGHLHTQVVVDVAGERLPSGSRLPIRLSLADSLVDFAAYSSPFDGLKIIEHAVRPGRYTVGQESFGASEITMRMSGSLVIRHKAFPLTLDIRAIVSPDVPLHGVLEATFTLAVEFPGEGSAEPGIYRAVREYALAAYGQARPAK